MTFVCAAPYTCNSALFQLKAPNELRNYSFFNDSAPACGLVLSVGGPGKIIYGKYGHASVRFIGTFAITSISICGSVQSAGTVHK